MNLSKVFTLSEVDTARLKNIINYPELIIRTEKTKTVAVCLNCHGEIDIGDPCLIGINTGSYRIE